MIHVPVCGMEIKDPSKAEKTNTKVEFIIASLPFTKFCMNWILKNNEKNNNDKPEY